MGEAILSEGSKKEHWKVGNVWYWTVQGRFLKSKD